MSQELRDEVNRLRPFAVEPQRQAMSRGVQFPTVHGRVLSLEQEIIRLRAALSQAIRLLDIELEKDNDRRQEAWESEHRE